MSEYRVDHEHVESPATKDSTERAGGAEQLADLGLTAVPGLLGSAQPLRRHTTPGPPNGAQSAGGAVLQVLRRKLHPSLRSGDVNVRLQSLLQKPGKGKFSPADTSVYEKIVASDKVYGWDDIQQEFGPFEENLGAYASNGNRQIVLYRADSRSPAKLKGANPPGFGTRQSVPFSMLKALMLKSPDAFVEDHVRQNRQDLKSYATDVGAGGFASNDRYLYKIDLGTWTEFRRPSVPGKLPSSVILSNSDDLTAATRIALDTNKPTGEIFLLFEVGLNDIAQVRAPNQQNLAPIAWDQVVAEK